MNDQSFVDSIKSDDLRGALYRVKRRINGLKNNSIQSLKVNPSDKKIRATIDTMSLDELETTRLELEVRIRSESP